MKDFDAKWQVCAARARQTPRPDDQPPFGFAARVVAHGFPPQAAVLETLWERLAVRLLAGVVGLLLLCAATELPHFRNARPLEPGIENTVAQIVWSL